MLVSRFGFASRFGNFRPMRAMVSVTAVHEDMKQRTCKEKGERQCTKQVRPVLGRQNKCTDRGEADEGYETAVHCILADDPVRGSGRLTE